MLDTLGQNEHVHDSLRVSQSSVSGQAYIEVSNVKKQMNPLFFSLEQPCQSELDSLLESQKSSHITCYCSVAANNL